MPDDIPKWLTSPGDAVAHDIGQEIAFTNAVLAGTKDFFATIVRFSADASHRTEILRHWTPGAMQSAFSAAISDRLAGLDFDAEESKWLADRFAATDTAKDAHTTLASLLRFAGNVAATMPETADLVRGVFSLDRQALTASLANPKTPKLHGRVPEWLAAIFADIRTNAAQADRRQVPRNRRAAVASHPGTGSALKDAAEEAMSRLTTPSPEGWTWDARARRDARTAFTGFTGWTVQRKAAQYGFGQKRWVAHHDERTRPTHRAVDGATVRIDRPFHVGGALLSYPGDPTASDYGEIVNCRCHLILVGKANRPSGRPL